MDKRKLIRVNRWWIGNKKFFSLNKKSKFIYKWNWINK